MIICVKLLPDFKIHLFLRYIALLMFKDNLTQFSMNFRILFIGGVKIKLLEYEV